MEGIAGGGDPSIKLLLLVVEEMMTNISTAVGRAALMLCFLDSVILDGLDGMTDG